jgi:hypothetical protein
MGKVGGKWAEEQEYDVENPKAQTDFITPKRLSEVQIL